MDAHTAVPMAESEIDHHIRDCAWLMESAQRRWEAHGCIDAKAERDRWKHLMETAIRERNDARTPAQVAEIEQARGLA
jgi:hypothetical protein